MTLTMDERAKFASYLERCAADNTLLVLQMEKLSAPAVFIAEYKALTQAQRIVADHLRVVTE